MNPNDRIKMRLGCVEAYLTNSLEAKAKELGVTRERVRQIAAKQGREIAKLFGPKEVWVLRVKLEPDWPYEGGWVTVGVFLTFKEAHEKLLSFMEEGRISAYDVKSHEIRRPE